MENKNEYPIWPEVAKVNESEIHTFVRVKNKENKWFLARVCSDYGANPIESISRLNYKAYRTLLFGVGPKDENSIIDPQYGVRLFELDKYQTSEKGRFYLCDDFFFPKNESPINLSSQLSADDIELHNLYIKHFKIK